MDLGLDDGFTGNLWGFQAVRQFLKTFNLHASDLDAEFRPTNRSEPDPSLYNPKNSVPKNLGDFDRLLLFCGKSTWQSDDKSTDSSSKNTTPPSSAPDDVAPKLNHLERHRGKSTGKEVRWKDEIHLAGERRKSIHGKLGDSDAALLARLLNDDGYDSDTETSTNLQNQATHAPVLSPEHLVYSPTFSRRNRAVKTFSTPLQSADVPPQLPAATLDPSIIYPFYALTIDEQKARIVSKMMEKFPGQSEIVNSVSQLGNQSEDGIHIFVDCSNIVIGFYNRLKYNRKISQVAYVKQPPISYHSLALVLERGRVVSRRVLVGSNPWPHSTGRGLPDYMREAAIYGYEVNMLERVSKVKRPTAKKKRGSGNGYATTSGQSSGSEAPFYGVASVAEQAVDELLQMKLLESLVDTQKPTTIVLASGDAAEAEFSGGFLKSVERALLKGWKVEIVAWRHGLSQEYRAERLLNKWKGQLTVIELDDFCEEMLAWYICKPPLFAP